MRKLTFVLALFVSSFVASAQSTSFKTFKVDLATGYAMPAGAGSKGGILFAIEPKYAINDNITLGLRLEGAVMARALEDNNGEKVTGDVKASASYLLTGDYYFNTNKFRPFAGLGTGIYKLAGAKFDSDVEISEEDVQTASKFGFAPRIGFELGHFRTAIEYNLVGKTGSLNNNYLGIKLGFFIGGGRLSK
jgi:outer membrane protein X